MKEIEVRIEFKYTTDNVWPNQWWNINLNRYRNWAAKTILNKDTGKEDRVYLDGTKDEDCFWCVAKVSKGDILAFGNHDTRRYNNDRAYYAVTDITEDSMKLLSENNEKGFTTIRKALKALKIWEETIEPHEESSPFHSDNL